VTFIGTEKNTDGNVDVTVTIDEKKYVKYVLLCVVRRNRCEMVERYRCSFRSRHCKHIVWTERRLPI
jgi:hypothetical protein